MSKHFIMKTTFDAHALKIIHSIVEGPFGTGAEALAKLGQWADKPEFNTRRDIVFDIVTLCEAPTAKELDK